MSKLSNSKLTGNSKFLRRNMTKEELHLWYDCLKKLPFTVNRQKVIGNYIADFYIASAKIVIELDGSGHYTYQGKVKDKKRDEFFAENGMLVLRYSNLDIHKNFKFICEDIYNNIIKRLDNL